MQRKNTINQTTRTFATVVGVSVDILTYHITVARERERERERECVFEIKVTCRLHQRTMIGQVN